MNKAAIKKFAIQGRKRLVDYIKNQGMRGKEIEKTAYILFKESIFQRYIYMNDLSKNGDLFSRLCRVFPHIFKDIKEYEVFGYKNIWKILNMDDLSKEDWKEVEVIGWLYQYYFWEENKKIRRQYNSEIKKEDIPRITQLFTPKWIVKYMVENTLGKLWIESTDDKTLENKLLFYIKNQEKIKKNKLDPKSIHILDPACGTGNILVYAFDVLYDIYCHKGYLKEDIPKMILKYNLYGLDIDERVIEISYFSLLIKALEKDCNILYKIEEEQISLNICTIEESNKIIKMKEEILKEVKNKDKAYGRDQIDYLLKIFYDGKEYGSIIYIKDFDEKFWNEVVNNIDKKNEWSFILKNIIKQIKIMNKKYDVVISNPPYISNRMMGSKLKKYANDYFKDFKKDLFSVFIKRSLDYTRENGYTAFMTPFVWMFIKSYEKLRQYIVENKEILNLIKLEYSGYEEATVPLCTFVIKNGFMKGPGTFIDLSNFKGSKNQPIKVLEAIKNKGVSYCYLYHTKDFGEIPGMPIAYWVSSSFRKNFKKGLKLKDIAYARVGLQTSDNKRFVRMWHEVCKDYIGFSLKNNREAKESGKKWFPYNKGGSFRKWYGNNMYVVNWENDGKEIREYNSYLNRHRSSNIGIANAKYYFKEGITWSFVSSSYFGVRFTKEGFIFDTAGSSIFPKQEDIYYLMGLMVSKVTSMYLKIMNPTLNFQPGNIAMLPIVISENKNIKERISSLSKECIEIAKNDWDSHEVSWDFKKHPLVGNKRTIEESYIDWKKYRIQQFRNMKKKEEEINKIFIDLYGLKGDITPRVEDQDITLKKWDKDYAVRSFISYAIGCIFGRYSLDQEGLLFAGENFNSHYYIQFKPEEDGMIVMDDMVSRFIEFIKIVFEEKYFNENIKYIMKIVGRKKDEDMILCMRRYFLNDFYKDHLKMYKGRPIYWMFTSGKYKALCGFLYIHRYNKDTISKIRNTYLKKRWNQLIKEKEYLLLDDIKNEKKIYFLEKQIEEIQKYDKILPSFENIEINLDDGISDNYKKFKKIFAKI